MNSSKEVLDRIEKIQEGMERIRGYTRDLTTVDPVAFHRHDEYIEKTIARVNELVFMLEIQAFQSKQDVKIRSICLGLLDELEDITAIRKEHVPSKKRKPENFENFEIYQKIINDWDWDMPFANNNKSVNPTLEQLLSYDHDEFQEHTLAIEAAANVCQDPTMVQNLNYFLTKRADYQVRWAHWAKKIYLDPVTLDIEKKVYLGKIMSMESAELRTFLENTKTQFAQDNALGLGTLLPVQIVDVPRNGACFYYSVYCALKAMNFDMTRFNYLSVDPSDQDTFNVSMRQALLSRILPRYAESFDAMSLVPKGQRYEHLRGLPLWLITIFQRGLDKKSFLKQVQRAFLDPFTWAGEIEISELTDLLAEHGILLTKRKYDFVHLIYIPNEINLHNPNDGEHFQYFKWLTAPPHQVRPVAPRQRREGQKGQMRQKQELTRALLLSLKGQGPRQQQQQQELRRALQLSLASQEQQREKQDQRRAIALSLML